MKNVLLGALVLLVGVAITGCASAANSMSASSASSSGMSAGMSSSSSMAAEHKTGAYHKVTPAEAQKLLQENKSIILVDVRTPKEYAEKHIPGARLFPNEDIKDQPLDGIAKDQPVLLYCRTGHRSKQAADKLIQMGYEHVYDMEGGITAWPYETESGAAK